MGGTRWRCRAQGEIGEQGRLRGGSGENLKELIENEGGDLFINLFSS